MVGLQIYIFSGQYCAWEKNDGQEKVPRISVYCNHSNKIYNKINNI